MGALQTLAGQQWNTLLSLRKKDRTHQSKDIQKLSDLSDSSIPYHNQLLYCPLLSAKAHWSFHKDYFHKDYLIKRTLVIKGYISFCWFPCIYTCMVPKACALIYNNWCIPKMHSCYIHIFFLSANLCAISCIISPNISCSIEAWENMICLHLLLLLTFYLVAVVFFCCVCFVFHVLQKLFIILSAFAKVKP